MNDSDWRIANHVVLELPFDDGAVDELAELGPVGQAALLLGTDDTILEDWYVRGGGAPGPMARVVARSVDLDEVADTIDATIDRDPQVIADLLRAGVTWSHPSLPQLLDRPEFRWGAAGMLSQTDPEVLEDWLDAERDPEEVIETARIVGLLGIGDLFDAYEAWWGPVSELDGREKHRLEAALFNMSPDRWSRLYLRGDVTAALSADWVAIADVLTCSGASYFAGLLDAVRDDAHALDTITRLALAGAGARAAAPPEQSLDPVIEAMEAENFALLAGHSIFRAATCLADDADELLPALVDAAAHDLLFSRGLDSPGIGGFPLSPTYPTPQEVEAALELLRDGGSDPEDELYLVATLVDLGELALADPETFAPHLRAAEKLRGDQRAPVARAAAALGDADVTTLAAQAAAEDIRGWAAAERLARLATPGATAALVDLWSHQGSLSRSSHYAALVFDVLRFLVTKPNER